MRVLIYVAFLLVLISDTYSQTPCEIQTLAIEAALGDADAQYNLAVAFHQGEAIPRDLAKAATLWRLAAKGGVISAYNNLGHLTYYGRGIKQDFAEGVRLWRVAASNGHSESQVHLGTAYSDGKFLKVDYVESFAWASVGKQSALRDSDLEMRRAIDEMASELLREVTGKLTRIQKVKAEQKAKLYISRYMSK